MKTAIELMSEANELIVVAKAYDVVVEAELAKGKNLFEIPEYREWMKLNTIINNLMGEAGKVLARELDRAA